MKTILPVLILLLYSSNLIIAKSNYPDQLEQSFFKLTTSNGLIVAVYDINKTEVEYVFPHIFANYDSGKFVRPFTGNIKLISNERSCATGYLNNTHIITASYPGFSVNYFASFTRDDKIFYIVIRGKEADITNLTFNSESGDGKILSGIALLTNSHEDLSVRLSGNLLTGSFVRKYKSDVYEKYFLFSLTDSLHRDPEIISLTIEDLKRKSNSLLDDELLYMQNIFDRCNIPENISLKEKNIVEQSISIFKMAQVSDKEIFPLSHGQILASLRPGLWHVSWVRDGSYAILAMTKLGMYSEARKGLEFMLNADAGYYKHFIHKDGKDYGVGRDYRLSVCRYFGNGKEESTYVDGPNIEFDNFGLFMIAFSDYVEQSKDLDFFKKWNDIVKTKIADVIVSLIDTNSLIRQDSGPWEHYLEMPRQYTFTSGVCAEGLNKYAVILKEFELPFEVYENGANRLKLGILNNMLCEGNYIKGNSNDRLKTDHEYYDAGVYEIFANGLLNDKKLFLSHMNEYDKALKIKGERPGYIRLSSADPYENQEWVFINLRIALAHLLFNQKNKASGLLDYITDQASLNNNIIPEMLSNKVQSDKVTEYFKSHDIWCNCIRDKDNLYIGAIPMVGYGSGAYILTLLSFYEN